MTVALAYITANLPEIVAALFAIHAAAVIVVNMTPTPKDDVYVAKFYRFIEILAGVVTKLSKM